MLYAYNNYNEQFFEANHVYRVHVMIKVRNFEATFIRSPFSTSRFLIIIL